MPSIDDSKQLKQDQTVTPGAETRACWDLQLGIAIIMPLPRSRNHDNNAWQSVSDQVVDYRRNKRAEYGLNERQIGFGLPGLLTEDYSPQRPDE